MRRLWLWCLCGCLVSGVWACRRSVPKEALSIYLRTLRERATLPAVKRLVSRGAAIESSEPANQPHSPVLLAATYNKPAIIRYLHKRGAKVDRPNFQGVTPLFVASMRNHLKTMETLLALGADAKRIARGFKPQGSCFSILQYTLLGVSPLEEKLDRKKLLTVLTLLLDKGAPVQIDDKRCSKKRSVLLLPILRDHHDVVKLLLSRGAKPTAKDQKAAVSQAMRSLLAGDTKQNKSRRAPTSRASGPASSQATSRAASSPGSRPKPR